MESKQKVYKIVFIRHGRTVWNGDNKYTGWVDVDLSDKGVIEVKEAAMKLKEWKFDVCHTSMLKRAIKSWNIIADLTDQLYVKVEKTWRLNERHYGNLQGLNQKDIIEKYSEEHDKRWRRGYFIQPPTIEKKDKFSGLDKKYNKLPADILPLTEVRILIIKVIQRHR
jgi:2,3-bisphosphoglycerate-dependent phosphoglycerate mutase